MGDVLDKGFINLIDSMGDDLSVVNSAIVSFGKRKDVFSDNDKQLLKYLLENKHSSPLEHVVFTFHVKCPLFIRSQWMRSRTWSFNEISRRYTSENIEFYFPEYFRRQSVDNKQASSGCFTDEEDVFFEEQVKSISEMCLKTYESLLSQGVAREMARMVLPQNLYTEFYGTVNLWNLFHFLELRNHPHAQYEIQVYAKEIENIISRIVPVSYKTWKNLKQS